jgi:alpha-beta hydrolase superfamily lysophospholipase
VNHLSSSFPDPRGTRLRYQYWEDSAKGYDRVALLLHGIGCHSGSYPSLVPAFVQARYKLVGPDFEGFGASPGERGSGGAVAMADAVEAICRRIESAEGAREIVIVAHSMGAIAAFLFLKRYPARRISVAAVAPLFFGVPVDATPDALAEGEAHRERIRTDPRFAPAIPSKLAADLDRTAKEMLADPSFLEGRKAAFFVGEADPLVPFELLRETAAALPLKDARFASFPRERHDPLGGERGAQAAEAIKAWFDETRYELRV